MDLAGADAHLQAIMRGERSSYRMERINLPQPNGGHKSYDLTILPFLPDNPQHGLFILVEDAIPLGILEQSLAQVRKALGLTQLELTQVKEQLEHLNAIKSLFLSLTAA